MLAQLELVAGAIAEVTDGALEADLVADVARLKRCVTGSGPADEFFRERLLADDSVREVIDSLRRAGLLATGLVIVTVVRRPAPSRRRDVPR